MTRLDSMPFPELNKLYKKSALLYHLGVLFFVVFVLSMISYLIQFVSGEFPRGEMLTFYIGYYSVPVIGFALGYIFMFVRIREARIFIYIWSAFSFLLLLSICCVSTIKLWGSPIACIVTIVFLLICLSIVIGVFNAARSDCLFGRESFTHKQIVVARKNKKLNIPFSDEQLQRKDPNNILVALSIVLAYASEFFIVISIVMLLVALGAGNQYANVDPNMQICLRVAENGDAKAQYILGEALFEGNGIEKNRKEAIKWFQKAAEQGNANAQFALGNCFFNGFEVEKNEKEAVKWFQKAAEQGFSTAQYMLGNCYASGIGVPEDVEEGLKWLKKAADQGDGNALCSLGLFYIGGIGLTQDITRGVELLQKSAEKGNADAQYFLGECLFSGNGIKENKTEAFKLFCLAAEQGNVNAQAAVGNCYLLGLGVVQNEAEGIRWLRMAALQGQDDAKETLKSLGL